MLAFIERFRAKSTKARQVQSRIRQLEKEEVVTVREQRAVVRFRFPDAPRSGKEVAHLDRLSKSYGGKPVYRDVSARILRGERIAVIGLNGKGKTTLLKLLAGETAPDSGQVTLGHNVQLGYYAQHHTEERASPATGGGRRPQHPIGELDVSRTVLDEVARLVPTQPKSWVRSVLGAFLFSGDDVDKRIGVLSGGEKARVALAKLLVIPSNFLLLDEPTNHLDLNSSEALIEALTGYDGTLLFVSHNRSFVNGLATQVWEVKDLGIDVQPGDLDDWERRRAAARELEAATAEPGREARSATSPDRSKEARRERAALREKKAQALGPLRRRIAELEERIGNLEAETKRSEAALADPAMFADAARATALVTSYRAAQATLTELYALWESAQEELSSAEAQLDRS